MKTLLLSIIGTLFTLLFSSHLYADCSFELFSISSTKNTKIIDFIEQLSDECEFTVIVTDPNAEKFLNTTLNKTHLKNLTINEVFNIILKENNLSYTLENNLLKISYLTTRVFSIDYILSQRRSTGSTDVTLSSSTDATSSEEGANNAESGIKIESNDEVKFWEELDLELQHILNRPHDAYPATPPIINKNAGLITVSATVKQLERLENYLKQLQDKVQLQVLIDVQILTVTMNDKKSTGVDWSQLYQLQNLTLNTEFTYNALSDSRTSGTVKGTGKIELNEVIKFLNTQGDVDAISNPKVLTLNNQPALITVGTEHFYKIKTDSLSTAGTSGSLTSASDEVKSVFAGVLLDITPEIADDKTITLKISPSLSETTTDISAVDNSQRTMPPDLNRRQLSSVVTVKDGNRIILGGLINTKNSLNENKVPLLGDIPLLGYAFKYQENVKYTQELVIIIEPHIINNNDNKLSLKDLGYKGLPDTILEPGANVSKKLDSVSVK